ncbi:hypothetical protein [uncultured Thiohalocapsa sp.]|uniref:hypothetical protein n=1 Tax=uncultured Thiohalocapsa sp. TaxID=768990 RepID=UPI0025F57D91|nr:hypothetical protein [uncultured Thiohalocapsa sp.]
MTIPLLGKRWLFSGIVAPMLLAAMAQVPASAQAAQGADGGYASCFEQARVPAGSPVLAALSDCVAAPTNAPVACIARVSGRAVAAGELDAEQKRLLQTCSSRVDESAQAGR